MIENLIKKDGPEKKEGQEKDEDAYKVGAVAIHVLDQKNADEHNRLHNLLCRNKIDIQARKEKIENFLKCSIDPLLMDLEEGQNDVKINAQLRSITDQANIHKMYNKYIIKNCDHPEAEDFQANVSQIMDLANGIKYEFEAAKDLERRSTSMPITR